MELRTSDKCLLEHKYGEFLELIGELKEADGIYVSKDKSRLELHRERALDSMIGVMDEAGHKKHSKLDGLIFQQRQQALCYPDASITNKVDCRKVTCDDFHQIYCLGMVRSKRYDLLPLFEWNIEE